MRRIFRLIIVLSITGLSFYAMNGFAAGKAPVSRTDFISLRGESFTVFGNPTSGTAWSKSVELKLVDVSELRNMGALVQFSVRFRGPADYPLDKAVYTFEQAQSGRFSLFLEPAGDDAEGRYYRAIFNSLR